MVTKEIEAHVMASLLEEIGRRTMVYPITGCLVWLGSISTSGYGRAFRNGRNFTVHRVSYEAVNGPVPDGLVLDHLCRNKACCNHEHLEAVTIGENVLRGDTISAKNRAATHCPKGHPLSGDNLYVRPFGGNRGCRACKADSMRRFHERQRERHKHF